MIAAFPDVENGVESRVFLLTDGRFSVTLFDVDAGETVQCFAIFADKSAAIAHAKSLVAGPIAGSAVSVSA